MRRTIICTCILMLMTSASTSTEAISIQEKYDLDNQLERVSRFWKRRGTAFYGYNLKIVDNQSFIFNNHINSYYLFVLEEPCDGLLSGKFVSVAITGGSLVRPGYSDVIVRYPSKNPGEPPFEIQKIYKLKDREQAEALWEQFSMEMK